MSGSSPASGAAARWAARATRAVVALSVIGLPAGAAERYREEWEADLAELHGAGILMPVAHALGLVRCARQLAGLATTSRPHERGVMLRRALAHFGLAKAPPGAATRPDGSYVFTGHLAWRPPRGADVLERSD